MYVFCIFACMYFYVKRYKHNLSKHTQEMFSAVLYFLILIAEGINFDRSRKYSASSQRFSQLHKHITPGYVNPRDTYVHREEAERKAKKRQTIRRRKSEKRSEKPKIRRKRVVEGEVESNRLTIPNSHPI